jgi:hypothetical protein
MTGRSAPLGVALALLGTLGACTSNLPETATTAPANTVIVASPSGATATAVQPGGVVVVPSGSTVSVTTTRLSGSEIQAVLAGNTASGTTSGGKPYYMKFGRGGTLNYREGATFVAVGDWRVTPDDQLCSRFVNVNSGAEQCYTLYRSADGYVYERPDGHPIGNFVVSPGA